MLLLTLLMKSGAMSGVWLNSPNTCKSLTQQMASLKSAKLWEPSSSSVTWGLTQLNWAQKNKIRCFWRKCEKFQQKKRKTKKINGKRRVHQLRTASDDKSVHHTEQDESLLYQRQLGSRRWWLKWSLPLRSSHPLTLDACRQLDAPENHTKRPVVGYMSGTCVSKAGYDLYTSSFSI